MTEQPICCGCYLNPWFLNNWIPPVIDIKPTSYWEPKPKNDGLTPEEMAILHKLGEAWKMFLDLDKNPGHNKKEFLDAIHRTQQIIALRVARRVNPEVWNQPE